MADEDVVAQHRLGSEGVGRDELGRAERAGLQEHFGLHLPAASGPDPAEGRQQPRRSRAVDHMGFVSHRWLSFDNRTPRVEPERPIRPCAARAVEPGAWSGWGAPNQVRPTAADFRWTVARVDR